MRIALLLLFLSSTALTQTLGQFNPAGKTRFARSGHTATLLPDGRVFFAGGICPATDSCQRSTEIFDPTTGLSIESGELQLPRKDHLALLESDGKVLLIGAGTVEVFDPSSGTSRLLDWKVSPRIRGQAHRLSDGNILLACGSEYFVEILNVQDGSLERIGASRMAPFCLSSAVLSPNNLLFADQDMNLSMFDRQSKTWSSARTKNYYDWDYILGRSASLLPNGQLVVAGGTGKIYNGWQAAGIFERFDANTLSQADGYLLGSRLFHADCLSPDGILLSGGSAMAEEIPLETILGFPGVGSAELTSLDGSRTERRLDLLRPRLRHTCTLLNDGSVLLAGGESSGHLERYMPINKWPELRVAAVVPVANGTAIELYVSGPLEDAKLLPIVWVGGKAAKVIYSSPTQINVLVPEGLAKSAESTLVFSFLERTSNTQKIRLD